MVVWYLLSSIGKLFQHFWFIFFCYIFVDKSSDINTLPKAVLLVQQLVCDVPSLSGFSLLCGYE